MLSNIYDLPQPLVEALTFERHRPQPGRFSVTTLIDSPLRRILMMRHFDQIEEDVSEGIWVLLGKMGHKTLEMNKRVSEIYIEKKFGDATLVGVLDYTDDCKVIDFKFTSVWSFVFAGEKSGNEQQLQIYAYLVQLNGRPVQSLENWMILRDWNKREALKSADYPKIPFAKISYPLWPRERVEAYIQERVSLHLAAEKVDSGAIPEVFWCTLVERWTRPTKYAVRKKGVEKAVRVLDNESAAEEIVKKEIDRTGKEHYIECRPGENIRCQNYCNLNVFCPCYASLKGVTLRSENAYT